MVSAATHDVVRTRACPLRRRELAEGARACFEAVKQAVSALGAGGAAGGTARAQFADGRAMAKGVVAVAIVAGAQVGVGIGQIVTIVNRAGSERELGELVAPELCEAFEAEIAFVLAADGNGHCSVIGAHGLPSGRAFPLVDHVVEAARTHAPTVVTLELVAPPALPSVAADADKLQQVLGNLVGNAVKYSPDGGRIEVRLEPRERDLCITVRDEGIGIADSELGAPEPRASTAMAAHAGSEPS